MAKLKVGVWYVCWLASFPGHSQKNENMGVSWGRGYTFVGVIIHVHVHVDLIDYPWCHIIGGIWWYAVSVVTLVTGSEFKS